MGIFAKSIIALGSACIIATALSIIPGPYWWVRLFDYPRVQVMVLLAVSLVLSLFQVKPRNSMWHAWLTLLAAALAYQASRIIVYTPFYLKQALDSDEPKGEATFSLLVSNVLMENRHSQCFLELVRSSRPDIVLVNEPDRRWERELSPLEEEYPFRIHCPLGNTYGMILYSKLRLTGKELNFLVEKDVPSVYAEVLLPSGDSFDFYGLHPRPPRPGNDTYERDAEILLVGKKVRERGRPAVVAGDMNDVAWSRTSALFQRYSGLLDPRHGRGMYNTFSAKLPLLRYPLDHVFYSDHFGFLGMRRMESCGSDHFPIFMTLNFEPKNDNAQDRSQSDGQDLRRANRKIREGLRQE